MNDNFTPQNSDLTPSNDNTSGLGKGHELPDGIGGWSWGAFMFNWIWALGNRT
jgi:hypothetical protein